MKLLLDQGLARSVVALLAPDGIDAVHVADLGYATATDAAILDLARAQGRVVVTLDADFHGLLACAAACVPSVVRIRIQGLRAEGLAQVLRQVCHQCAAELIRGAAVTVQEDRIRVRLLPFGQASNYPQHV
ncbi:MAG: DUF5615 family PIN-like protein [Thermodesulfobacteriota bacterium]